MTDSELRPVEILLVEDNEGDVFLTKQMFSKSVISHNISVAMDGEEALDFLYKRDGHESATRPDLVLLDLNMPKKDGREVLQEIKQDEDLRSIPVVVITSSNDDKDVAGSYSLHANSYLVKPVDLDGFTNIVKSIEDYWFSAVTLPPHQAN